MKKRKILVANWKMNLQKQDAEKLITGLNKKISVDKGEDLEVIVIPPYIYIQKFIENLVNNSKIKIGAQNISSHEKGAHTGEISAEMLESIGCKYVLIGHSETRYALKNDKEINNKIKLALKHNLTPIYCFGETLEQRAEKKLNDFIEKEFSINFANIDGDELSKIIIAYEPIWSIGTGVIPSTEDIAEVIEKTISFLSSIYNKEFADKITFLYGGSCNSDNALQLSSANGLSGLLVGSSSIKINDFCKIIDLFI